VPGASGIRDRLKKIRTQGLIVGVLGLFVVGFGFCVAYQADQALGELEMMVLP